jgi:hypothetical protein
LPQQLSHSDSRPAHTLSHTLPRSTTTAIDSLFNEILEQACLEDNLTTSLRRTTTIQVTLVRTRQRHWMNEHPLPLVPTDEIDRSVLPVALLNAVTADSDAHGHCVAFHHFDHVRFW